MNLTDLAGDLINKFAGEKEGEGEAENGETGNADYLNLAEKGLGALGINKETAINKGEDLLESATGLNVGGLLGKFGFGGEKVTESEQNDNQAESLENNSEAESAATDDSSADNESEDSDNAEDSDDSDDSSADENSSDDESSEEADSDNEDSSDENNDDSDDDSGDNQDDDQKDSDK